MKKHKLYRCMGENFGYGVPIGNCGDVKTLEDWIDYLSEGSIDFQRRYAGWSDKQICESIYANYGKRLELD